MIRDLSPVKQASSSSTPEREGRRLSGAFKRLTKVKVDCKVETLAGHVVETCTMEASGVDRPKGWVYVIPGNPGLANVYQSFMQKLYSELGASWTIKTVGYIGHNGIHPFPEEQKQLSDLDEQVKQKRDWLKEQGHEPRDRVVLIGHSIGSHIITEMARDLVQTEINFRVVALFPFFKRDMHGATQNRLWHILGSEVVRKAACTLVGAVSLLPDFVKDLILRIVAPELDVADRKYVMRSMVRYNVFNQHTYLGMCEFRDLNKEIDFEHFQKLGDRMMCIWGEDDHWGPLKHKELIAVRVPTVQHTVDLSGIPHAFCTQHTTSVFTALHVASFIEGTYSMSSRQTEERRTLERKSLAATLGKLQHHVLDELESF
eukprot:Clim_evm10s218 gene=Clim_evmTU10s218